MYNPSLEKDFKRLEQIKINFNCSKKKEEDFTLPPSSHTFFLFHCMPRAAFFIKGHNRPAIDKNFL
jgi:hypothetical protein